jgi:hypothetical protein
VPALPAGARWRPFVFAPRATRVASTSASPCTCGPSRTRRTAERPAIDPCIESRISENAKPLSPRRGACTSASPPATSLRGIHPWSKSARDKPTCHDPLALVRRVLRAPSVSTRRTSLRVEQLLDLPSCRATRLYSPRSTPQRPLQRCVRCVRLVPPVSPVRAQVSSTEEEELVQTQEAEREES